MARATVRPIWTRAEPEADPLVVELLQHLPAGFRFLFAESADNAAKRVQQALGMVNVIEIRPYLGAEPALCDWVFLDG